MSKLSVKEADVIVKELLAKKWFAAELKTDGGVVFARILGYERKGKRGRILYTEKARSSGIESTFEEAFYLLHKSLGN